MDTDPTAEGSMPRPASPPDDHAPHDEGADHEPSPPPGPGPVVTDPLYCLRCGYQLRGLHASGRCPECGTAVELSLAEPTLAAATPEYLASLARGLRLILAGLVALVVITVVGMFLFPAVVGLGGVPGGGNPAAVMGTLQIVHVISSVVNLAVALVLAAGYVLYTAPDPREVAHETTTTARRVVRAAVAAQVVIAVVTLPLQGMVVTGAAGPAMVLLVAGVGLLGSVAWAAQYFATLRYTRWLATRVPDDWILRRTKVYMWLLPVLVTVGSIACGLGPVVALVLYWNLLHRLRQHVVSIQTTGTPRLDLKGL